MTPRLEWRPAKHNQITLPQLDSEVVNLTGLAENKGLIVSNGKRIVCSKKTGSRLYSRIKEKDRGPQFTRGVSPQDIIVLGKKIAAGQLTHEKILDKMNIMRLIGHYNKDHRPPSNSGNVWLPVILKPKTV